jgi:hypothetical protein
MPRGVFDLTINNRYFHGAQKSRYTMSSCIGVCGAMSGEQDQTGDSPQPGEPEAKVVSALLEQLAADLAVVFSASFQDAEIRANSIESALADAEQ